MKKITTKDYAVALYDATKNVAGKELEQVLGNFVQLLVKNHKLKQAEKIIAEFVAYAKKQGGIQSIEITSVRALEYKALGAIKDAFGEKVEAEQNVDENLLGGFVVRTSDKIFDASLKTQLAKFKEQISF